jgi:aldehyde:ferredoxin oxidoreductase
MHNIWDEGVAADPIGESWQAMGVYTSVPTTVLDADKVRAYTVTSNKQWLVNSLGLCMFIPWENGQIVEIIRAITGWTSTNLYELLTSGARAVTMMRAFNMREGITRADDVLPKRMERLHVHSTGNEVPVTAGTLDQAVTQFYGMMGWDTETGAPTRETLQNLDIAWIADAAA